MSSKGRPPFWGCMLMNSRGGPPLGTIPMDLAVHGHKTEASGVCTMYAITDLKPPYVST